MSTTGRVDAASRLATAAGTTAGVGFSEKPNSSEAGAEAARDALASAGLGRCDLVLIFATSKHDPVSLRDAVRSIVGPEPRVFGGSAVGVITNERMGYEGFQVAVATVATNGVEVDLFIEKGLPDNEHNVGRALGGQIKERAYERPPNLLLLYDLVKRGLPDEGVTLNLATPLIAGLAEGLGVWPPLMGGGLAGDMQFNPNFQWFDDRIEEQSAMALALSGDLQMDTIIMHGCTPASAYWTVTKADRNVVLEFDGRPARDMIAELLGPESDSWEEYPLFVTLGINKGDRFSATDDDYAVRVCMDIDKQRGGLVMFDEDMQAGTEVQLMRRTLDVGYVERRAREVLERAAGRTPFLAVYIDCAARAGAYCGTEWEEAEGVQKAIGSTMPLIGWYVGCELAKAGPDVESHNWTGVLSIFSQ